MFQRLLVAAPLGLLGLFAVTGIGEAAKGPDATEVAVGTALAVAGMMALLLLIYGIKVALGGEQMPPAEDIPGAGEQH